MNNKPENYEYQVYKLKGRSKYPPEILEQKLRAILERVGEVDSIEVRTPPADNSTFLSLAVSWGYVENYLLQDDMLNSSTLVEVTGLSSSSASRRLKELFELGIIYGGPREYNKHPAPPCTLAEHLVEHPLYRGKWEPKHITFGPDKVPHIGVKYRVETKGREVNRVNADRGIKTTLLVGPLYNFLEEEPKTTTEIATFRDKNRSSIHRTMTRLMEVGLVKLEQDGSKNLWSLTDLAVKLRAAGNKTP